MTRTRRALVALLTALALAGSGALVSASGASTVNASWSSCCF